MPKKSKKKAQAGTGGAETIGQRLARLRRERGLTQVMLADSTGIIQALVSDYERDKLRLNPDMSVKLAQALGVTTEVTTNKRKWPTAIAQSAAPPGAD